MVDVDFHGAFCRFTVRGIRGQRQTAADLLQTVRLPTYLQSLSRADIRRRLSDRGRLRSAIRCRTDRKGRLDAVATHSLSPQNRRLGPAGSGTVTP